MYLLEKYLHLLNIYNYSWLLIPVYNARSLQQTETAGAYF